MSIQNKKSAPLAAGEVAYQVKPDGYFSGTRPDFVNELPNNPNARILEIGCGEGGMGRSIIAAGKCANYHAVELFREAADVARQYFDQVIQGDIEKMDELPWQSEHFDAIIMSEVLEHLADPLAVLRKLRVLLKPGGIVLAGSPNVAHHRVIRMLLRGEWQLEDSGPMDRTHLRWFTPKSFKRLFEDAGFVVDQVVGLGTTGWKGRAVAMLLCGHFDWLFAIQIKLKAHR